MDKIYTTGNLDRYWVGAIPVIAAVMALTIQFSGVNQAVFLWLNQHAYVLGETFWSSATLLGDGLAIFALLGILLRWKPNVPWAGLLATPAALIWTHGLKYLFAYAQRPPALLPLDTFHVIGPALKIGSFPSGHTTAIFTFAAVWVAHIGNPWQRALVVLGACVVGFSRIAVGVHWPLDVLGGVFGGWIAGALGVAWAQRWNAGARPNGLFLPVFLLLCSVALFFHDIKYDLARAANLGVAAVATALVGFELWSRLRQTFRKPATPEQS